MALDVTPGGSASDSYLSLADALLFANADLGQFATHWKSGDGVTDAVRETALRRATRDIDRYVGSSVDRWVTTQRLAFPRYEDVDALGLPIIVPRLKEATYQQAIYVLSNADVIDAASTRRARALTNFSEPNVSGQIADDSRFGKLAPEVITLLTGEGFEGGAVVGWIETT
jgi:hypothetical protein